MTMTERQAEQAWVEKQRVDRYASTVTAQPRVRARVLRCVACPAPARGLEPYCANCADWHAIDDAIVGPAPDRRAVLAVGVVLGLLALLCGGVLVAGWLA